MLQCTINCTAHCTCFKRRYKWRVCSFRKTTPPLPPLQCTTHLTLCCNMFITMNCTLYIRIYFALYPKLTEYCKIYYPVQFYQQLEHLSQVECRIIQYTGLCTVQFILYGKVQSTLQCKLRCSVKCGYIKEEARRVYFLKEYAIHLFFSLYSKDLQYSVY